MCFFFFQAEDGIRDGTVTGVQTCALPIFDEITDLSSRELTTQLHPDEQLVLAESIGAALVVVLETLAPSERLAFVLHDMRSEERRVGNEGESRVVAEDSTK